jgi:hypothetical protein
MVVPHTEWISGYYIYETKGVLSGSDMILYWNAIYWHRCVSETGVPHPTTAAPASDTQGCQQIAFQYNIIFELN